MWHTDTSTLAEWSRSNCDKIQPRPADMSCADVVKFASECDFSAVPVPTAVAEPIDGQPVVPNYPKVLGRYIYYNANTARDYGQYGNWYYPNYYPPTYLGYYDGRAASVAQLENDYKFAQSGHYPYTRADNIVNIGLQQTSLPTCLHDLFYCVRAANGQRATAYQNYNEYHRALRQKARDEKRRQARIEDE